MRFIVASYGSRHVGMLAAHLHSVARSNPESAQTVYFQDLPARALAAIRVAFPQVDFRQTHFDFAGDPVQRIASKLLCWTRAAEEFPDESILVFADADTLVRRSLAPFPKTSAAEIFFTHKPAESVPLNTGVILARGGPAAAAFFRTWRDCTLAIFRDPAGLREAADPQLPYGAPDQMSLFKLLRYERPRVDYALEVEGHFVRAIAQPCAQLNETNSRPLTDEICVIHYKAGWQRILLDGRPFSRFRPRLASWEMLTFFLETFREALARLNASGGGPFRVSELGICWPWYYRDGGHFSATAYAAWRVKEAGKRGWWLLTGQLKSGQ